MAKTNEYTDTEDTDESPLCSWAEAFAADLKRAQEKIRQQEADDDSADNPT